jgi:hypothetical protein
MTKSRKELALAYERLCDELSRVLYEEDPARIGKSIGAPRDEYNEEAARLATALRTVSSRDEIEQVLQQVFHTKSTALVERVERAMTKFHWRTST